MCNKKLIGLIALFVAIGMLLVIMITSRIAVLIIIALLLFLAYCCFSDC